VLGTSCTTDAALPSPEDSSLIASVDEARAKGGPKILGPSGRFVFGRDNLARRAVHSWHELGFDLISYEASPVDGAQHRWALQNPTSFGVERVSAVHANEIVVAGRNRQGETVIEVWRYPPQ